MDDISCESGILSRYADVQRNMKPIRSPRTPETELRTGQPAGGLAGSPGQLGSRLSGQREPTVTTPEQLQPYLVQLSPPPQLYSMQRPGLSSQRYKRIQ